MSFEYGLAAPSGGALLDREGFAGERVEKHQETRIGVANLGCQDDVRHDVEEQAIQDLQDWLELESGVDKHRGQDGFDDVANDLLGIGIVSHASDAEVK